MRVQSCARRTTVIDGWLMNRCALRSDTKLARGSKERVVVVEGAVNVLLSEAIEAACMCLCDIIFTTR